MVRGVPNKLLMLPDIVLNRTPGRCRLLYVIGQLGLGGAERQLYYLLANLDRSRYHPCLVVWNYNSDEKYYRAIDALKIPIYGLPARWSPITKLQALGKVARALAPEVVHSYVFFTNFAAYYAARGTGALAIGSLRSDIARSIKSGGKLRGALNSRLPHWHISNSVVCVEAAHRYSSFFVSKQYIVVRNGLDLTAFRTSDDALKKSTYVASVGSLLPVKRWDRLLKAVQKVMSTGIKDARFCLAGDGPLRSVLEQSAGELGVSHAMEFLGAIHDIPAFLRNAKFLVHTSESEGCPNAVMEAMAAGRAIVATDAGDIPYFVEDGKTGFVVRQDDDEALINRIVTLLTNPDLCREMGKNARAKAEQEFELSSFVTRTLDAYRAAGWKDENQARRMNEAV
ncbi:MAG: glycosyltransferase family 4 protein [Nitrospira sp.]|nr:glycosyltransferase family 4 protein [Nitrospira sp.]